jgi:hypothetical protein
MTRNNRSGLESQALITCYVILSDERAVIDEEQGIIQVTKVIGS